MPRIRQNYTRYAEEDFLKHLRVKMAEMDIPSVIDLSARSGVPYNTLRRRLKDPSELTIAELRKLDGALHLDPDITVSMVRYRMVPVTKERQCL